MPKLIFPSLQVNMRAGHFSEADTNDVVYLKVPLSKANNNKANSEAQYEKLGKLNPNC